MLLQELTSLVRGGAQENEVFEALFQMGEIDWPVAWDYVRSHYGEPETDILCEGTSEVMRQFASAWIEAYPRAWDFLALRTRGIAATALSKDASKVTRNRIENFRRRSIANMLVRTHLREWAFGGDFREDVPDWGRVTWRAVVKERLKRHKGMLGSVGSLSKTAMRHTGLTAMQEIVLGCPHGLNPEWEPIFFDAVRLAALEGEVEPTIKYLQQKTVVLFTELLDINPTDYTEPPAPVDQD